MAKGEELASNLRNRQRLMQMPLDANQYQRLLLWIKSRFAQRQLEEAPLSKTLFDAHVDRCSQLKAASVLQDSLVTSEKAYAQCLQVLPC